MDKHLGKLTNLTNLSISRAHPQILHNFINLRKLKISKVSDYNITELFDVESQFFQSLKSLSKLDIRRLNNLLERNDEALGLIEHFFKNIYHQFKSIKFPILNINLTKCKEIQKNYPDIRFCWYIKNNRPIKNKIDKYKSNRYEGEFNDRNLFEGKGVYIYCIENNGKYIGEWKNGNRDGRGIELYYTDNGTNKYDGEWKKNRRDGKGILYYYDGSRYEGEWKKNNRNGRGTLYYRDRSYYGECRYEGEWKNNKRHGKGVLYYPNGSINYEGEWKNNYFDGKGIFYYQNGDHYEGKFYCHMRHGKGNYYHSNGDKYEGRWVNGEKK